MDESRKAFEEWAIKSGHSISLDARGRYVFSYTATAWAGWQHWYCVYVLRKDIWDEAKLAEEEIGYAIHKDENGAVYLEEREELFAEMDRLGIQPNEHIPSGKFWSIAKQAVAERALQIDMFANEDALPCECST